MTLAIKTSGLNKVYANGVKALQDLELEVKRGSFFALLGPNGGGKSTLINILAGVVTKTSGQAEIMGVDIDKNSKKTRSMIGVVPQELVMDSFFPIGEALDIHAGYYGIRPAQNQTNELLKSLSLYDKRHNTSRQLSGGMKRRFLVAKAMVHNPPILILDEPTAGVDIELREQLWDYVKELNQRGTTIIITTHYLEEAETLCDHIAFINKGKIIKSDSKENLMSKYNYKEMLVDFAGEITNIPFELEQINAEQTAPNRLKIAYCDHQLSVNTIIEKLRKTKLDITNINIVQADLEDIFKQVIN